MSPSSVREQIWSYYEWVERLISAILWNIRSVITGSSSASVWMCYVAGSRMQYKYKREC